jgi:aspergillopepsin I
MLFTVSFNYNGGGTATFGYLDSTQYTGSVSYTPASTWLYAYSPLWGINITSYSVGTGSSNTFAAGAVVDTGTNLLVFPASVTKAYWAKVTGAVLQSGSYIFPCNATLPDLHFVIQGGIKVTIHGPYMNANGPGATAPNTMCNGALQTISSVPFSIFGLQLFQSMFVVFDYGGSRVGFATKTLP